MGSFTPHKGTHRFISNDTPISWASSLFQWHTTFHLRLRENDTPNSWASSLHRGIQCSTSISERNYSPISWEHPTHGLSLKPTPSVCVPEDVSHNCNHQHSLSAREAFSVENPGPISKTSWSVFDQAKSLSFLLS
jgi:hypothetical protein